MDDPLWGLCIDNAALADAEPKAAQTSGSSKLAEYDWIKLPNWLSADDLEIVEASLADIFWDPVYQVPVRDFVGVCRYFHERGFFVDVDFWFDRFKKPEPDGTEGIHKVSVTLVNRESDMGFKLTLAVMYNCPALKKVMARKNRDTGAKSFLLLGNDTLQTERYSQNDWLRISGEDWYVIMRAIIEGGYVEEG